LVLSAQILTDSWCKPKLIKYGLNPKKKQNSWTS
jgi:hypothetical protein